MACGVGDDASRRYRSGLVAADLPTFELDVRTDGGRTFLVPRGELDLATAPGFESRVLEALRDGTDGVVLDLRELTFMDSTGVRVMVLAHQTAQERDVELRLVRPAPGSPVLRIIEISGIDEALGLVDAP